MYVKSDKIKFYPSAYRYYVENGASVVTDEEASKNTEYNLTSRIAKVFHSTNGCFITSGDNATDLEFFIGGYYTKIDNVATNLLANFSSDTKVYANIKTALVTPPPTQGNWDNLYEVVEFEHEYKPLDYKVSSNIVFEGISFENTANANATFSLLLFERETTSDAWALCKTSKYALSLSDILGNADKSAREEIKTNKLITTDAVVINGTITALGVSEDVTIGRTLYVDKIMPNDPQAQEVWINHSCRVDCGLTVGLDALIQSGLTVIGTSTLEDIKCFNITPRGNRYTVGSSQSKFYEGYFNTIYGNLEGDITSTGISSFSNAYIGTAQVSTIVQASQGVPIVLSGEGLNPSTDDGFELGASNLRFKKIYATSFEGNASSSSKLNLADAVGNSSTAVYFTSSGNPVATNWNTTLYNRIESEAKFLNTTTVNPNASAFYVFVPNAYVSGQGIATYMNIYAIISLSGDYCTFNFVSTSPNLSSSVTYTNEIAAYDKTYRLLINGPYDGGSNTGKFQVVLQSKTTGSWSTASEHVFSAVVHYTVRRIY